MFISYRRDDTVGLARDLYKSLLVHFRAEAIFFDADGESIRPGDVFLERIDRAVSEAQVVLVLIARGWLQASDSAGQQRLHLDDDVVRRELRGALSCGAHVVPVLFDGVSMPSAADLPRDLAPLAARNAIPLPFDLAPREAALARLVALINTLPGVGPARRTVALPVHERRLQALRRHYLGGPASAQTPAFVGRRAEMDALDAWLADPRGAPRLLLHGPAAIGKTSLLLHWLRDSAAGKQWRIVHLPISVRFDTNSPEVFWAMAAAQLGAQLAETRPHADDALDLALAAMDQLEAEAVPILIVIDGLDEAVGWKLPAEFRMRCGSGLRWLVGLRAGGDGAGLDRWLADLGWQRNVGTRLMPLVPLGREAVLAAVAAQAWQAAEVDVAGAAQAVADAWQQVGEELWRVCAGDPLLLGYHLDDLAETAAAGMANTPVMLARLRAAAPGFSSYFSDWLAGQRPHWQAQEPRDDALDALLALLANAMGPLPLEALQNLLQAMHGGGGAALHRSRLAPLRRFVIESEAGYTLAHPRLAEALALEFGAQGPLMRQAQAALLAWCRAGGAALAADAAGAVRNAGAVYIVRHRAQHLAQTSARAAEFMELAREPWLRASLAVDDSGRQLMVDLELAREAVISNAAASDPLPAWRLWLAVARASVQTRARIEPELLVAFARLGHYTPAQVLRRLELMAPRERAVGLVRLASLLPADERLPLIEQALEAVRRIGGFEARMRVWAQVTAAIAEPEARNAAEHELLGELDAAPHLYGWLEAVDAMAPHLGEPTLRTLLQMVLAQIGDHSRWDILDTLWSHLPRALHDEGIAAVIAHAARLGTDRSGSSAPGADEIPARVSAKDAQGLFENAPTGCASAVGGFASKPAPPTRVDHLPDAVLSVLFADLSQTERDACWQRLLAHARSSGDETALVLAYAQAEPWLLMQGRGARVRARMMRFQSSYSNRYGRISTYAAIARGQLSEAANALLRRNVLETLNAMSADAMRVRYAPIALALLLPDECDAYVRKQLHTAPDGWRWKELAALVGSLPVDLLEAMRAQATQLHDGAKAALAEAVLLVHAGATVQAPELGAALARLMTLDGPGRDEVHDLLIRPVPPEQREVTFGPNLAQLAGDARTLAFWHTQSVTPTELLAAVDQPDEISNVLRLALHCERLNPVLGADRAAEEIGSLLIWNEVDLAVSWLQVLPSEHARAAWERLESIAAEGVHGHVLSAACHLLRRDRVLDPVAFAGRFADLRQRIAKNDAKMTVQQAARLLEFAGVDEHAELVAVLRSALDKLHAYQLEDLQLAWPHLHPSERAALSSDWLAALRRLASSNPDEMSEWLIAATPAPDDMESALLNALPDILAEAPRSTWLRVIAGRAPLWRHRLGEASLRELAAGIRGFTAAIP